jgi:hypothetical protein
VWTFERCEAQPESNVHGMVSASPTADVSWLVMSCRASISKGAFLAIDPEFFVAELCSWLLHEAEQGAAALRGMVDDVLESVPFDTLCHRLLHILDDRDLLEFADNIWAAAEQELYTHRGRQEQRHSDGGGPEAGGASSSGAEAPGAELGFQAVSRWSRERTVFGSVRWQQLDDLLLCSALAFNGPQLWRMLEEANSKQVRFKA